VLHRRRVAFGVDDQARAVKALQVVVGKQLTYRNLNVTATD
jgi:hypothetical protein